MKRAKEILVTDDEAAIRSVLFDLLTNQGFRVTLAKDGQDSLDQMENHSFDLLITDIHMPRLDGMGLLRRMKEAGRKEKVILMTGNPLKVASERDDTYPVLTLVHKPFRLRDFLDMVADALEQHEEGAAAGIQTVSRN